MKLHNEATISRSFSPSLIPPTLSTIKCQETYSIDYIYTPSMYKKYKKDSIYALISNLMHIFAPFTE